MVSVHVPAESEGAPTRFETMNDNPEARTCDFFDEKDLLPLLSLIT